MTIGIADNVIYGQDKIIAKWVNKHLDSSVDPHPTATALGFYIPEEQKVGGGVIYDRWNGVNIEAAIAITDRRALRNRRTIWHIFQYPFVTLGARRISCLVARSNSASLRLCTRLGFQAETALQGAAADGGDTIVMMMFRDDCPWL